MIKLGTHRARRRWRLGTAPTWLQRSRGSMALGASQRESAATPNAVDPRLAYQRRRAAGIGRLADNFLNLIAAPGDA
jgi:hypothetical protein